MNVKFQFSVGTVVVFTVVLFSLTEKNGRSFEWLCHIATS